MTVAAAFALRSEDGTSQVGVFADSRVTLSAGWEDGQDKLLPLSARCCAVGCGPSQPLQEAAQIARSEIEHRRTARTASGGRPLSFWHESYFFLHALHKERARSTPDRTVGALVAGFSERGAPLIAEASFSEGAITLFLFMPKLGEFVARVVGARAAVPLVAEALRMDFANQPGVFDRVISLLRDAADDKSDGLETVGGPPCFGVCSVGKTFQYPICEVDGFLFRRGSAIERTAQMNGEPVCRFNYDPTVFKELDTRNQASPLFTGGAPLASFLDVDGLQIGDPTLFQGEEPQWLKDEAKPVPMMLAAHGLVFGSGFHTPESGMAHAEKQSVDRYLARSPAATKGQKKKKRRRR